MLIFDCSLVANLVEQVIARPFRKREFGDSNPTVGNIFFIFVILASFTFFAVRVNHANEINNDF